MSQLSGIKASYDEFVKTYEWHLVNVHGKPVQRSLRLGGDKVDPAFGGLGPYELTKVMADLHGPEIAGAAEAWFTNAHYLNLFTFTPDYELAKECPPSWAPDSKFLVVTHFENVFVIATPTPTDPSLRRQLTSKLEEKGFTADRAPVLFFVLVPESILAAHIPKARMAGESSVEKLAAALSTSGEVKVDTAQAYSLQEYLDRFTEARDKKLDNAARFMLDFLLARAYSPDDPTKRASDVHIEPGPPDGNFRVRYRINGRAVDYGMAPMSVYTQFATAIKGTCSGMVVTDRGMIQDGRYRLKLRTGVGKVVKLDLRVSCMPSGSETGGDAPEKFVFRILDSSGERPTITETVGGDVKLEQLIRKVLDLPKGMILLTGPTGCGKCLGKGTLVMMADGSLRKVEEVVRGDLLMGPDSRPRRVLRTNVGHGKLYTIIPAEGAGKPWVCNDVHVMTLQNGEGEIFDLPLNELVAKRASGELGPTYLFRVPTLFGKSHLPEQFGWSCEESGEGDYYGFTLDGDGRFLLGDYTVTHNTTTLSRFILELGRDPTWTIFTLEDPIEYEYNDANLRVTQIQIDRDRGVTFATGLRCLLRSDPDIILVGEMRDEETAELAVRAALTGHQVLSTLHTNDAVGAVSRLVDMKVKPYLVADTLSCVIAQRLLQKLCPSCKQSYSLSESVKKDLPEEYRTGSYARSVGCPDCGGSGYKGRVPCVDVMYVDSEMREMIASEASSQVMKEYNEKHYSPGLFKRALGLARQGTIDILTAFSVKDDVTN
jgi:type II secretory ATPase GspE/PulE/Tfp pilus assembly ATPase PilB-like protein